MGDNFIFGRHLRNSCEKNHEKGNTKRKINFSLRQIKIEQNLLLNFRWRNQEVNRINVTRKFSFKNPI